VTDNSSSLIASAVGNGARSVMARRVEQRDSLDYFPTPPWATRALVERVLPHLGVGLTRTNTVWECACGEGHMSEVLAEYATVIASDIASYRPEQKVQDFLDAAMMAPEVDWVITNPPFGDRTTRFILRAFEIAHVGVAMFTRTQWATEGVGRYDLIFRDRPPTCFAPFVERVPLCKGRWDPDGSTATAYCWLIWALGKKPTPPFYIPPGCRKALTRSTDRRRFAPWSVPQSEFDLGDAMLPTAMNADDRSLGKFQNANDAADAVRRAMPAACPPIALRIHTNSTKQTGVELTSQARKRVVIYPRELKDLIAEFGRYDLVTPEAWAKWDRQQEEWRQRCRADQCAIYILPTAQSTTRIEST
jgi:hypothetical protein